MSRLVVLDTETTGLNVNEGHRIIEIGAVEIVDRRLTGKHFHEYLNPARTIEAGALEVHGITEEFLADKPGFADVAEDFLAFVSDAELVIHNAAFDVGFLDSELSRLAGPVQHVHDACKVTDSLAMARERHPGQKNSLDALCSRYQVDNSERQLHGALLDAEILADVYLAMTGGQATLALDAVGRPSQGARAGRARVRPGQALRVVRASAEERESHESRLTAIEAASGKPSVWRGLEP